MTLRNDLADYETAELLAELRRRLDLAPEPAPAREAARNYALPGYEPPETAAYPEGIPEDDRWFAAVRRS